MSNVASKAWHVMEVICHAFFKIICQILRIELTVEREDSFLQFVKFGIVGLSNTIISYVLYVIFLFSFQRIGLLFECDYLVSQVISFVLSVLWSFYWNNRFVFTNEDGRRRCWWKTLLKTYISYSFTGLFLNSVLIIVWVRLLHISEYLAPIINLIISVPLNFIINKFWAFKTDP